MTGFFFGMLKLSDSCIKIDKIIHIDCKTTYRVCKKGGTNILLYKVCHFVRNNSSRFTQFPNDSHTPCKTPLLAIIYTILPNV